MHTYSKLMATAVSMNPSVPVNTEALGTWP